jgi:hypothetical protein
MKLYEFYKDPFGKCNCKMKEYVQGDFVDYDDYEKLLKENEELKLELEAYREELEYMDI